MDRHEPHVSTDSTTLNTEASAARRLFSSAGNFLKEHKNEAVAALAAGALTLSLAACGSQAKAEGPGPSQPTTEAPLGVIPNPTSEPSEGAETEAPQTKDWGTLEIPEADPRLGMRDFGSKEAFFDWFKIDADKYNTPELIAQKHIQDIEGMANASLTYQYDENMYISQSDGGFESTAQNIQDTYLTPLFNMLTVPEASNHISSFVGTEFIQALQKGFWGSYDGEASAMKPLAAHYTYESSKLIAGSIEEGTITVSIAYSMHANTEENFTTNPNVTTHYVNEAQFVLDDGDWKIFNASTTILGETTNE